jgi:SAM-dependent methyltransferase
VRSRGEASEGKVGKERGLICEAASGGKSIRGKYERHGAETFYREQGGDYRNPHEQQIGVVLREAARRWNPDLSNVLDLAAGSGEATLVLRELGAKRIAGIDPFTAEAYGARTGLPCERIRFEEIAAGAIANRHFSLLVCSFAMHLCPGSRLAALALQLSLIAPGMIIVTPHKRPMLREKWGWKLEGEFVMQRVRARWYRSGLIV